MATKSITAMLCTSLVAGTMLCGCVSTASAPPTAPASLAGTTWKLVSIQSMDDKQGTTRPDDPARYTLSFGADGRAVFRLDCNRATADWRATPATDRRSGQLIFGDVASTRALCPPPSLDERVVRQLPFVRGYLLERGQLHLSLLADGGILSWTPHEPQPH